MFNLIAWLFSGTDGLLYSTVQYGRGWKLLVDVAYQPLPRRQRPRWVAGLRKPDLLSCARLTDWERGHGKDFALVTMKFMELVWRFHVAAQMAWELHERRFSSRNVGGWLSDPFPRLNAMIEPNGHAMPASMSAKESCHLDKRRSAFLFRRASSQLVNPLGCSQRSHRPGLPRPYHATQPSLPTFTPRTPSLFQPPRLASSSVAYHTE
jgi:hypothetical protein